LYNFKFIVIGDGNVGKTSIKNSFIGQKFMSEYLMTIGVDFAIKSLSIDGEDVKLQVWDVMGQSRFSTIRKSFYLGAKGVLLTYDVTERKSFENLMQWIKEIRDNSRDAKIIIVGNKIDLERRNVNIEEAQTFAQNNNTLYIETSAKTGQNINLAFETLARHIIQDLKPKLEMTKDSTDLESDEVKSTLPADLVFNKDILVYDSEQGYIK
jgi:small GTP-binding protein